MSGWCKAQHAEQAFFSSSPAHFGRRYAARGGASPIRTATMRGLCNLLRFVLYAAPSMLWTCSHVGLHK